MIPDPKLPKAGLFSPRTPVLQQGKKQQHTNIQQTIKKLVQSYPKCYNIIIVFSTNTQTTSTLKNTLVCMLSNVL